VSVVGSLCLTKSFVTTSLTRMNPDKHQNALNKSDRLHWYEIESILGQGGFGITYLALDTNLNHKVAIKEYLPVEFATRNLSGDVLPISDKHVEMFDWGKKRFLDEARTLFPFKHPNIVRVLSFFEFNNTGYIVMEYVEGVDFADLIRAGEPFSEDQLLGIINPILEGLSLVHDQGYIHRDIKPRNIVIRTDGSPVLIDFGSARQALGEQTRTLTTLVTPGYSPLEQYHGASGHQGPWTDIYALGATLYAGATGSAPVDSMQRNAAFTDNKDDVYKSLVNIIGDKYSEHFLRAIDHALEFNARERPQNLSEWGDSLCRIKPTQEASANNNTLREKTTRVNEFGAGNPVSPIPSLSIKRPAVKSQKRIGLLLLVIALGIFTYPRWVSTPDITSTNPEPILNNNRAAANEKNENLVSKKIPPGNPGIPKVRATDSKSPQTITKATTRKNRLKASVSINGFYGSEITYTKNNPDIDGHWYFGEDQDIQVKIEQRGNDVLGFIKGAREGRIEGSYSGNEINFRFYIIDPGGNANHGTGVWFVARDGKKMIGKWFLLDLQDRTPFLEGDWILTRPK